MSAENPTDAAANSINEIKHLRVTIANLSDGDWPDTVSFFQKLLTIAQEALHSHLGLLAHLYAMTPEQPPEDKKEG